MQHQHQHQEVNTANTIPAVPNPQAGAMSSFSSMLLRILGGAPTEGLNSFLSMFRDVRDEDEAQVVSSSHRNKHLEYKHEEKNRIMYVQPPTGAKPQYRLRGLCTQ
ncbi:hypothetical protein YC2023_033368 [Brassica napus]